MLACLHLILTCWPIMQKVRSCFKLELLIKLLFQYFPHGTNNHRLYTIIFSLRGRFPQSIQTDYNPFYFKTFFFSCILLKKSRLIYTPKVNKIFQFTLFNNYISNMRACLNNLQFHSLIYSRISGIVSLYTIIHLIRWKNNCPYLVYR